MKIRYSDLFGIAVVVLMQGFFDGQASPTHQKILTNLGLPVRQIQKLRDVEFSQISCERVIFPV